MYWAHLEAKFPVTFTSQQLWAIDIGTNIVDEDWWNLFSNFLKQVYATKLRYMQLLYRD